MRPAGPSRRALLFGLGAAAIAGRAPAQSARGPVIFAAASLRDALAAAVADWSGAAPVLTFAGSATLARQIEAGAPADIFLSANRAWTNRLATLGAIDHGSIHGLLTNRLVLAGPDTGARPEPDLATALEILPADARIATGFLEAVPAGIYARQALTRLGLFEALAPRLVQTENVRIAAMMAARGDVARAFIYATDLRAHPNLSARATVAPELHDPIEYPLAVTSQAAHRETAALAAHLRGPSAAQAFRRHGFEVLA